MDCPLCEGWGVRFESCVDARWEVRCVSCEGAKRIPRPQGWRPWEPCTENTKEGGR